MTHNPLSKKAATERQYHNKRMIHADFDQAPFTIAWEVTRACAYACVHCRADAQHQRDPRELNAEEALQLIDRLAEFGSPILIFTGGDPMMRRDLFDLIASATEKGLRCSLTPTATALPTKERLQQAKEGEGGGRLRSSLRLRPKDSPGVRRRTHPRLGGYRHGPGSPISDNEHADSS